MSEWLEDGVWVCNEAHSNCQLSIILDSSPTVGLFLSFFLVYVKSLIISGIFIQFTHQRGFHHINASCLFHPCCMHLLESCSWCVPWSMPQCWLIWMENTLYCQLEGRYCIYDTLFSSYQSITGGITVYCTCQWGGGGGPGSRKPPFHLEFSDFLVQCPRMVHEPLRT